MPACVKLSAILEALEMQGDETRAKGWWALQDSNTPAGAPKTKKKSEAAQKAAHFSPSPALPPDVAALARQLADLPPDVRTALAKALGAK